MSFSQRLRAQAVAWLALCVAIAGIIACGYVILNERDNRITENARLACAVGAYSADLATYFEGARVRIVSRIGTKDELSTDKAGLVQLETLLDTVTTLRNAVEKGC